MNSKRIAIVTPVVPPYAGGIGRAALEEAKMLAAEHEVTIFTPKYPYIHKDDDVRSGVIIRYIKPAFSFSNAALLTNLQKELAGFDIVYLQYPFFGVAEKFSCKSSVVGRKFVIRYHMDVIGRGLWKPLFLAHTKLIMPRILKQAGKIIVSTFDYARNSNIQNLLQKRPEKFVEIPFGVDIEKFKPEFKDPQLFVKHAIPQDSKIILFVGGLDSAHYFKGLDVLLEAVRELSIRNQEPRINRSVIYNASFVILVIGDGNLRPYYESITQKFGVADQVRFIGKVSEENLPRYYNLCDIFVFPSVDKSEAFGLALLEALACGKAAVASNLPGVRMLIAHGKNGFLFTPGSSGSLAEMIISALSKSVQFGINARERVTQKYTNNRIKTQLLDTFRSL